jgi:mono/diheme cytochrome c family protein
VKNLKRLLYLVAVVVLILALYACQGSGNGDESGQAINDAARLPVPAEYANLVNPLPLTAETIRAGEQIFLLNCASCHGETGKGDGPLSRTLTPKPSDLALLAASVDDAYIYWRIAEGGAGMRSSMPAWKSILTEDEIWMGVAFIRNLANK